MKWLIIPTQSFSGGKLKKKEEVTFEDLPWIVRLFLKVFKNRVFVIHDEISWIKTNVPMDEKKKSSRSRTIKLLEQYSESRCGMTGTLMTKSPVNVLDPYQFLSKSFFEGESAWDIAETYSIMITLRAAKGARVIIPQKEWDAIRKRMINAYKFGGEVQLAGCRVRLRKEYGLSKEECEHILISKQYNPFINIDQLMKRMSSVTMTVNREDIFDISHDKFVYKPIRRYVTISDQAKTLGNQLVKVGFTDNITLGKTKALELMIRLQDLCNGFEPIKDDADLMAAEIAAMEGRKVKVPVRYEPLPENPKLDALVDLLQEIDTNKNQVVVWCSRRNAFASIEERLTKEGISFVSYSGSQTDEQKKEAEQAITDGSARIFIANPASAAFGLNALKELNYMVWYTVGASVEQYHQAQHRILRGQSKAPKFAYEICVKGSVEERNYRTLEAGQELLGEANNADIFRFAA